LTRLKQLLCLVGPNNFQCKTFHTPHAQSFGDSAPLRMSEPSVLISKSASPTSDPSGSLFSPIANSTKSGSIGEDRQFILSCI
jgi:hypothetical protein